MKYKGIIFDLDGTLADTLADISNSMNRVLVKNGFDSHPAEDYKLLIGRGLDNLVRTSIPESSRQPVLVSQLLSAFVLDYSNNCLTDTKLYEGIEQLLSELQKRMLKLSVFSNKADELTVRIVSSLLPHAGFICVAGARNDLPRKPDPSGALLVSRQMMIDPGEIIYIGDSDVDMITAKKAGMLPVGVLWGFRSKEELLENGAMHLLVKPSDLISLLD